VYTKNILLPHIRYIDYLNHNKVNNWLRKKIKLGFFYMIITIDGPAAAGKGTLAQKLAEKYGLAYFDTGMVYRAVGLELILQGKAPEDEQSAEQIAQALTFAQMTELSHHQDFRSALGGQTASKVAAIPSVRQALLKMQQNFAKDPCFADGTPAKGVVYDGRDTGTVVCPKADLKLFVTASSEVRAMRRHKEYLAKGMLSVYEDVLAQTKERDIRDSSRASAPLKPADDAVIIDTSDMNIDEVFLKVCALVEKIEK
jgi:cytidylate kinase